MRKRIMVVGESRNQIFLPHQCLLLSLRKQPASFSKGMTTTMKKTLSLPKSQLLSLLCPFLLPNLLPPCKSHQENPISSTLLSRKKMEIQAFHFLLLPCLSWLLQLFLLQSQVVLQKPLLRQTFSIKMRRKKKKMVSLQTRNLLSHLQCQCQSSLNKPYHQYYLLLQFHQRLKPLRNNLLKMRMRNHSLYQQEMPLQLHSPHQF